ncbi:bactofilin family protein [Ideonella sp.]|uniref:bactofilin family protein n=1 Tax=Ideonella sp. TaxID=1929293 RepID=UPI003BB4CAE3
MPPPFSPHRAPPAIALGRALPERGATATEGSAFGQGGASQALPRQPGRHSTLAAGAHFAGNVTLRGALTVAGRLDGAVTATDPAHAGHVTVTRSGWLQGELHARSVSVMGEVSGLLDAAGGRVVLHDTAVVQGRLRYSQLQVNGAALNADIEHVRAAPGDFADADEPPSQHDDHA